MPKLSSWRSLSFLFTTAIACLLLLSACSLSVKKDEDGRDKNVDIRTPFGRMHVEKHANGRDTGLAVYPGARLIESRDDDENHDNANVSMSFGDYGLKVAVAHYESDDPAEKIIAFYKEQLKEYGNVLECPNSQGDGDPQFAFGKDSDSKELRCGHRSGDALELKAGRRHDERVVAIRRKGTATSFSLIHVETHDAEPI